LGDRNETPRLGKVVMSTYLSHPLSIYPRCDNKYSVK